MNSVLAALFQIPGQQSASGKHVSTKTVTDGALFKSTFATALGAATTGTTKAATGAGATNLAALQATLQKKITDLLNKGFTASDIANQLAASLAASFQAQFGGSTAQVQAKLQQAFTSALAPPGSTGPPPSAAELAVTLAQRFRQIAEIATGVGGSETGQTNRLFAGSNLDAATTAGVQPAPQSTTTTTAPAGPSIDSILSDASSALASLLAAPAQTPAASTTTPQTQPQPQGDGRTVAIDPTQAIGSNGDTLLGRTLARALLANQTPAPVLPAPQSPATATPVALAGGSTVKPLDPALASFLRTFTNAIAQSDSSTPTTAPKKTQDPSGLSTLFAAGDPSQLPSSTVTGYAPVQAPIAIDSTNANAPQPAALSQQTPAPAYDPNGVVDQVLRGVFLQHNGTLSDVRLHLVPESLGSVTVKLSVDQNGSVNAHAIAQNADVQNALQAGAQQLTRSLADAGLKLTSFTVSIAGGGNMSFAQQQQQSQQQPQSSGRRMLLGGVDTAANDDALLAAPTFGPPLVANQNFSALNYLA